MTYRKCDQQGCASPATHTLIWTKPQFYCLIHLAKALAVAEALEYDLPSFTIRPLPFDEMFPEEEVQDTQQGDARIRRNGRAGFAED